MKNGPVNAIALVVVVALLISLYAQWSVRTSLSRELSELQGSVDALGDEVRELRATVDQRLGGSGMPSGDDDVGIDVDDDDIGDDGASDDADVEPSTTGTLDYSEAPVDIVLAIASDGSLKLDGRAVSMDELETELKHLLEARPAMHLIVQAGDSVAMDDVTACVDAAGKVGIHNVDVATQAGGDAPEGE